MWEMLEEFWCWAWAKEGPKARRERAAKDAANATAKEDERKRWEAEQARRERAKAAKEAEEAAAEEAERARLAAEAEELRPYTVAAAYSGEKSFAEILADVAHFERMAAFAAVAKSPLDGVDTGNLREHILYCIAAAAQKCQPAPGERAALLEFAYDRNTPGANEARKALAGLQAKTKQGRPGGGASAEIGGRS